MALKLLPAPRVARTPQSFATERAARIVFVCSGTEKFRDAVWGEYYGVHHHHSLTPHRAASRGGGLMVCDIAAAS